MAAPAHAKRPQDRAADPPFALALVDEDAAIALAMLKASEEPVTIEDLRMAGVYAPAQALYELQLAGYAIERVSAHPPNTLHGNGYKLAAARRARTPQEAEVHSHRRGGRS